MQHCQNAAERSPFSLSRQRQCGKHMSRGQCLARIDQHNIHGRQISETLNIMTDTAHHGRRSLKTNRHIGTKRLRQRQKHAFSSRSNKCTKPRNVAAASAEPPPRPAAMGRFFCKTMRHDKTRPICVSSAAWARITRLSSLCRNGKWAGHLKALCLRLFSKTICHQYRQRQQGFPKCDSHHRAAPKPSD